ncbi:hypothetical protein MJO29_013016 [Puccinia striiformis f. sp. tritici]|nr:hypothetical protein MJO29_013016 [Puccinia striiformis f. sp. tritici]
MINSSKICRNVIEDLKDPTVAADEENINIIKFVSLIRLATKVSVVLITATFFSVCWFWINQLVQTILDQAHLSPFPIPASPVIWEQDQALRLYPMPTAVRIVLPNLEMIPCCVGSYPAYTLTYEECHVFNPGSFGIGSRPVWANYHMATCTSEQRSVALILRKLTSWDGSWSCLQTLLC